MPEERCREYERLEEEAHKVLKKIGDLADAQRNALQERDDEGFTKLDRELELAVGHKERVIGALRNHAETHGCQPPFLPEI